MASVVTLAARVARNSTKSSSTKEVRSLNEKGKDGQPKFGAPTRTDVVSDFFSNKLSPAAAVVRDWARGYDFDGKQPTATSTAKNLFVPLPITNYEELRKNPNSANDLLTLIADGLGIGTNTYSDKK
jgi:hypothetical protein